MAVDRSESSRPPQPLFVAGVTRSGTSLTYRLLSGVDGVRLSYESHLLTEGSRLFASAAPIADGDQFGEFLQRLAHLDRDERLNAWLVEALAEGEQALWPAFQADPRFEGLVEAVYRQHGARRCWGNKMLRLELADEILRCWPNARFIVLVRDPRAVYASQRKKFDMRRVGYSALYWNLHARLADQYATALGDRLEIVRYEDLASHPRETLTRLLELAELGDERLAAELLEQTPVLASSIDRWRDELAPHEIKAIEEWCFETMARFEYQPVLAERSRRMSPLRKAYESLAANVDQIPLNPMTWRRKRLFWRLWMSVKR